VRGPRVLLLPLPAVLFLACAYDWDGPLRDLDAGSDGPRDTGAAMDTGSVPDTGSMPDMGPLLDIAKGARQGEQLAREKRGRGGRRLWSGVVDTTGATRVPAGLSHVDARGLAPGDRGAGGRADDRGIFEARAGGSQAEPCFHAGPHSRLASAHGSDPRGWGRCRRGDRPLAPRAGWGEPRDFRELGLAARSRCVHRGSKP
jgi:hypothetical protein